MLRMTRVSKRLGQTLLLVLLSSLIAASVNFLPPIEYRAKEPSFSEQSNLLINPRIARATDELHSNLSLNTDRVTDTVKRLIDQASDKAERQFKRNFGDAEQPATGLRDAIKLTLVESIGNALRE